MGDMNSITPSDQPLEAYLEPELWQLIFSYLEGCMRWVSRLVCKKWREWIPPLWPRHLPKPVGAPPSVFHLKWVLHGLARRGYIECIRDICLDPRYPPIPYRSKILVACLKHKHLEVFHFLWTQAWVDASNVERKRKHVTRILGTIMRSPHDLSLPLHIIHQGGEAEDAIKAGNFLSLDAGRFPSPPTNLITFMAKFHREVSFTDYQYWLSCAAAITGSVELLAWLKEETFTTFSVLMLNIALEFDRVAFIRDYLRMLGALDIPPSEVLGRSLRPLEVASPEMMEMFLTEDHGRHLPIYTDGDALWHALQNKHGHHMVEYALSTGLVARTRGPYHVEIDFDDFRRSPPCQGALAQNLLWVLQEHPTLVDPSSILCNRVIVGCFGIAAYAGDTAELEAVRLLRQMWVHDVEPMWPVVKLFERRSTNPKAWMWAEQQRWLDDSFDSVDTETRRRLIMFSAYFSDGRTVLYILTRQWPELGESEKFIGEVFEDAWWLGNYRLCAWLCERYPQWRDSFSHQDMSPYLK